MKPRDLLRAGARGEYALVVIVLAILAFLGLR
jgi:hypothetical protein